MHVFLNVPKMTAEERCLYTRYFYNAVIEFIHFVIIYIEACGTASLSVIVKHVKFFKIEVYNLISLFEGETENEKLCEMLKVIGCFIICDNEIKIQDSINLKTIIFEELVISKCVDLLLKRQNDINVMCSNLKINCNIIISKQDLLCVIKKYSYFSVESDQVVSLHHIHGLLGFENYLHNAVISFFHNILYHCKTLPFKEIGNQCKLMSFCGITNFLGIFCILICSDQFHCQNGHVVLNKNSMKYPKKKPIRMEQKGRNFSSGPLPIGQIVYKVYGPFLHRWHGEIWNLKQSSGIIYCVVDFTNGYQRVFNVFFSKAALKVISELKSLKEDLKLRDDVEFDAEYCSNKKLDRYWKATRVKLLSNKKFQYNEKLSNETNSNSELQRSKCTKDASCSKYVSSTHSIENINSKKRKLKEKTLKRRTSDYESWSSSNSSSEVETVSVDDVNLPNIQKSLESVASISNMLVLDYQFMFGYIYLLMEDKAVAIAEHKGKYNNILFMKDSIYPPIKTKHFFLKGQKILAFIPYIKELGKQESFCVSTLVYGLNEEETNETECNATTAGEFAIKMLLSNLKNLSCNIFSDLRLGNFVTDLKYKIWLIELYEFITTQFKMPFVNDQMLLLLHCISKANFDEEKLGNKMSQFMINLSKCFPKCADQKKLGAKCNMKLKKLDIDLECDLQIDVELQKLCTKAFSPERITSKRCISDSNLTVKSLDISQSSTSLLSYKTCSMGSSDIFFSCNSTCNTPVCLSNYSLDNGTFSAGTERSSPCKTREISECELIVPLPTILNAKCNVLSMNYNEKFKKKEHQKFNSLSCKYLSLRSVPSLKSSFKKMKRIALPYNLKPQCKDCVKNSLKVTAKVSLICNSFFYFTTTIDGHNVVLPLPKQDIPSNVLGKIKLNSPTEITVIPGVLVNLSHIVTAKLMQ